MELYESSLFIFKEDNKKISASLQVAKNKFQYGVQGKPESSYDTVVTLSLHSHRHKAVGLYFLNNTPEKLFSKIRKTNMSSTIYFNIPYQKN